ncbi:hypothetical protein [Frondihabitans peucedani]|uniref:Uncharacterized protein n=1 Tax=Frondihabitans peucedani TaxID=598626 RepID=A0ABP8E3A3_9MICO
MSRFRFPTGLVGRRDGFLIVLTGFLGLTREQARKVTPAVIEVGGLGVISIQGTAVARAASPGECPRCAVAGWLSVIAPHYERLRASFLPLLDPTTAVPGVHVCELPVGDLWRSGVALLPSIDRTGAVGTGEPISVRAITTIIGQRRIPTGRTETLDPVVRAEGRYRDATSTELAAAQDDVLNHLDSANQYLEELLAEAELVKQTLLTEPDNTAAK